MNAPKGFSTIYGSKDFNTSVSTKPPLILGKSTVAGRGANSDSGHYQRYIF